jgi:beta-lactamase class C
LTNLSRRRGIIAVAAASWGLPALAAGPADRSAAIKAVVDSAVKPLLVEHDIPGMAVAVAVDGVSYFFDYGVASRETGVAVSRDTLFEIGSVSKAFTATLVCYAQAVGKLSLQDHPGKYVGQLNGCAIDKATLLHLETFTAGGLPLQVPDSIDDFERMLAYLREWTPEAPPGTQRRYSNPSIGLLGHIAGVALGGGYTEEAQKRMLPALGLNHSYIKVPQAAMDGYAWGYGKAGKPIRVNPGVFDAEAYGVKSTAADMIRFVQANIDPGRLSAPMRQAVEGTQIGFFRVGDLVQGLGWEQYPYPLPLERLLAGNSLGMIMEANPATPLDPPGRPTVRTLFNKTGSTNGFGAYVAFVPAQGAGLVLLANRNYPIAERIKVAHTILGKISSVTK